MSALELVLASEVAVRAPPAVVWAVLVDAAAWTAYNPVVTEVHAVPSAWVPGERVAYTLRMAGRAVSFDVRLTDVDPPRRLAWTSRRWTVTGDRAFTVTPTPTGAVVEDRKTFTCGWFPVGWCYPRGVIRAMSEGWLAAVRDEAERRA